MWGVHTLSPENLNKLQKQKPPAKDSQSPQVPGSSTTRLDKPNFVKRVLPVADSSSAVPAGPGSSTAGRRISRLDILACLYACCDSLVFQDILRIIAQFPVALPFIIPNVKCPAESPEFVCLASLLKYIRSKWEVTPETVRYNQLFCSPFKMVVALRLGSQTRNRPGKSTILNQVLTLASGGVFASRSNSGSEHGKPLTLDGTVEFCILSQEIATSSLWTEALSSHYESGKDEVLLLANLHGDALQFPETLKALTSYASAFIVFLMPMSLEEMQESCSKLEEVLGGASSSGLADIIIHTLVDATEDCLDVLIPEKQIQTGDITSDTTSKVTRRALREAFEKATEKPVVKIPNPSKLINYSPEISCFESQDLVQLIAQGPAALKSGLKLQVINPKADFLNVVSQELKKNEKLRLMTDKMIKLLLLPVQQRMLALAHLDLEMSQYTAKEAAKARATLMELSAKKFSTAASPANGQAHAQNLDLDVQIKAANKELGRVTLGIEHLYRELGRLYLYNQSLDARSIVNPNIVDLPSRVAGTMIQGNAIEILDGDSLYICGPWFNAICSSICRLYPGLKVFVLSIIGLQSSGKSTLLNALFACKFAVSAGRCTSGLFMRLLFLEKNLADELGVDAIVVLDTEGLGAPEKMNDPEAERRDRILATFAMSVSNLTLINVLGESLASLTDILQIVIVTMARLEQAEISPDILMVQHVFERDGSKVLQGAKEFSKALEAAVNLTSKLDMDIGIQNSTSLKRLESRVKSGKILNQFPPFKNGATVNAPPSPQYHESIKNLFNTILEYCRDLKVPQRFRQWQDLIPSYWDAVSLQDFSLRFKNIREIQDFIDRGKSIQTLKTALDKAFKEHRDLLEAQVLKCMHGKKFPTSFESDMKKNIQILPELCPRSCSSCNQAIELQKELNDKVRDKDCEIETQQTVSNYIQRHRDDALQHLVQRANTLIIEHTLVADLDNRVEDAIQTGGKGGIRYEGTELDRIAANVWEIVQKDVVAVNPSVPPASGRILVEIQSEYKEAVDTIVPAVVKVTIINLGSIPAIDRGRKNSLKHNPQKLESVQVNELYDQLKIVCASTLKGHVKFETGMVHYLKRQVNSVLDKFQKDHKITLIPGFKWKAHEFALVHFKNEATILDDKWNQINNPMWLLESRKDQYMERIRIRLQSGYGAKAEGRIIGSILLKAVQKVGQVQGDEAHERHVIGTSWLINSEHVRLRFFSELAKKVKDGQKKDPIAFFLSPEITLKKWFSSELDRISKDAGVVAYKATVENELKFWFQNIRNQSNFNELQTLLLEFLIRAGNSNDTLKLDSVKITPADFQMFKDSIIDSLKGKETSLLDQIVISSPSASPTLLKLLGCTKACFWCNALCWGGYEHDKNSDDTKRHHTCHQPAGLSGTADKNTQILFATPCNSWLDTISVTWSKFPEGLNWQEAKEKHFSDWMFSEHNKNMFNDLMKWFFVELNKDIAEERTKKPVSDSSLDELKYKSLDNINLILNTIKQRIQGSAEEGEEEEK